jgi:hypothetical protein
MAPVAAAPPCPGNTKRTASPAEFGTECIKAGGMIDGSGICTLQTGQALMRGPDGCPVATTVPGMPEVYPGYMPTAKPSMMVPLVLGAGVLALMLLR